MSGKQSEMEGRLDDMLSRIAVETQEIEELERQLTDGQILANESLQRDLEGIISGLQEYLRGLREQARLAQHQVVSLQAENQSLQLHLEHSARTHRQDLSVQQEEADALRERQVQLEAELTWTQDEKASLQLTVWRLQAQCEVSRTVMDRTRIQLDQITEALLEPQELHIGPEHTYRTEDMLSRSVEQLLRAIQLTRTRTNQDQSQEHIHKLHYQITQDQDQITQDQDQIILNQYRRTKDQDQIPQLEVLGVDQPQDHDQDQDQDKHQNWRLQEELQRLRVRLQESESRNRVLQHNREQLQDVQQERDALLLQSVGHQRSLERLNRKLRQLSRDMRDQLTVDQLRTTSQQLRDLTHTLQEEVEEHTHIVEQLGAELHKAQRHKHRTRTRARTRTRNRKGERWCFIPPGHTDSGLGLQDPHPEGGQHRPPAGGGKWVDSGGGSDAETSSRETPETPAGGVPPHRDTQGDRCVCEFAHKEAKRLEEEKKKVRLESKQLRHTLRQHRSVMQVCDEVECVEKTLLKRQAELRRADRLLLEAQSCTHTSREQEERWSGELQRESLRQQEDNLKVRHSFSSDTEEEQLSGLMNEHGVWRAEPVA